LKLRGALSYPANNERKEAAMLSFVTACVAAVLLAGVGAVVLDHFQEPVSMAFATVGVRL
jgi:hypothetical protein